MMCSLFLRHMYNMHKEMLSAKAFILLYPWFPFIHGLFGLPVHPHQFVCVFHH